MASIEPNMGLRVWDQLSDKFDKDQLALNWAKVAAHDHTSGKGVQIPTGGIANLAITGAKIANSAIGSSHLSTEALSTIAATANFPVGMVIPFAGVVIPTGWLLADGAAYSRVTYANLWNAFRNGGSTSPYGNGNGTTTFNVPNFSGGVPIGIGSSGTAGSTSHFLGQRGGEETHVLTEAEMPAHNHQPSSPGYFYVGGISPDTTPTGSGEYVQPKTYTSSTGTKGGSQAHNNMPPYTAIQYLVKF